MYMVGTSNCVPKMKRIGNPNTRSKNIQSGHRNGIWHKKCTMLRIKSRKQHIMDRMELPNQDKVRTLGEKEISKYLGILEADTIKQEKMKGKNEKEYFRRTRKLLETKLYSRNFIKGIKAFSLVRYFGLFLKWTREELKQMDQRTRLTPTPIPVANLRIHTRKKKKTAEMALYLILQQPIRAKLF